MSENNSGFKEEITAITGITAAKRIQNQDLSPKRENLLDKSYKLCV